ncbi:RNA-binding protein 40 [Lingula anatina]|uniref:RNA-binding region-containing protein 3 n=1 Tax=Lingula anatina TaxID=7574 RepID=A0A1S3IPT4_LINAN|nr:RNA-binding protein 40 [Lingula anatina]|eukprot:XP_013400227.1 RNA-binding protein 40 [Lingula anatina]
MADALSTLFIRHLPAELTEDEKGDLLKHFGAVRTKCMGTAGRLRHTAFAVFDSKEQAEKALERLHQLEILGCRLSVEFSKKQYEKFHPKFSDSETFKDKLKEENFKKQQTTKIEEEKVLENQIPSFGKIAEKLGIDYPYNPNLHYIYPPPDVNILTNIAHALATVPKFYVQVLHLMNKMNMPAPFGLVTPAPPLPEGRPIESRPSEPDWPDMEEMEVVSTDESEIQSDTDDEAKGKKQQPVKRQKHQKKRPRKKLKLHDLIIPKPIPSGTLSNAPKAEDVFEQPQPTAQKKIEIKVPAVADQIEPIVPSENLELEESFEKPPVQVEEGGFGKIEPVVKEAEADDGEESDSDVTQFISSSELKRGRLSSKEMKDINVFKRYDAGDQTSRLYIKNLAKHVTEKDLKYVFGRYIDWTSEEQTNMFDIRHMTEGRMKGQAFVTLPNEDLAQKALNETNGFVLNGKPMVVQFARSAKPKEKEDPKSKETKL